VRRSLGGILLLVAAGCLALGIGLFSLQRVAFSPEPDTSSAFAILDDEEIRGQIAIAVAQADAPTLGTSSTELREFIEQIAQIEAGAAVMTDFIADAHATVIGDNDGRVEISPAEQVQIVRNERVALNDPVFLPVQRVAPIAWINTVTFWTMAITLGVGVLTLLAGLFLRPERGEASFAFAVGCTAGGVSIAFFGFVIPALVLPALSDDIWMGVFPHLARNSRNLTLGVAIALVVIGAVMFYVSSGRRDRRQFSSPLNVRYREQPRWGR
jgi:hypothetical protein